MCWRRSRRCGVLVAGCGDGVLWVMFVGGGMLLITHRLCTLALTWAGFGPVGLARSGLFGGAGCRFLARCAGNVGCCRGDGEVRRGARCFGLFADFGDTLRDCSGGGTLDTGS